MDSARPIPDGQKMSRFGHVGGQRKIGGGSSFDRIVALEGPGRMTLGADHGPIQIDGNFQQAQGLKFLHHQLTMEFNEGF